MEPISSAWGAVHISFEAGNRTRTRPYKLLFLIDLEENSHYIAIVYINGIHSMFTRSLRIPADIIPAPNDITIPDK